MTEDEKIELLGRTELFRTLPTEVLQQVARRSAERRLSAGEILFLEGEPATDLYVIASGAVRAFRTGPDGREQTIHVEHVGSTIAEVPVFDLGPSPSTVAAEGAAVVLALARDQIRALCLERPAIALGALGVMASRLRQCAALVETLSLREVGQRLARLFLEEAEGREEATGSGEPRGRGVTIELDLSREQIASRVGTVREVVSRTMSRLQNQRLIVVDGRRITIPDAERLASYARDGKVGESPAPPGSVPAGDAPGSP